MKKILLLLLVFGLSAPLALADIAFDSDHKWVETFDCPEAISSDFGSTEDIGCSGETWATPASSAGGEYTRITTAANNASGGGGRGYREFTTTGINLSSGHIKITFPSAQTKLWIRWKMRYEAGYSWEYATGTTPAYLPGYPHYDKQMYLYTDGGVAGTQVIMEWTGVQWAAAVQSVVGGSQQIQSSFSTRIGGWLDTMGGAEGISSGQAVGDGLWHEYQTQLFMDTATGSVSNSDGKGLLWVDNVLLKNNQAVNFSDGKAAATPGWIYINLMSNQSKVTGGTWSIDIDDIWIVNDEASSVLVDDGNGNLRIEASYTPTPETTTAVAKRATLKRAIIK